MGGELQETSKKVDTLAHLPTQLDFNESVFMVESYGPGSTGKPVYSHAQIQVVLERLAELDKIET